MKILFKLSLLTVIFLISAQFGYACSCFRIENKEEVQITDFIFVGKVIEITEDESYVPPKIENASEFQQLILDSRKRFFIKFKIEKKFKGVKDDEITLVKYEQNYSPCEGLSFEKEKTYLVYADKVKDSEEIRDNGLCSRTQNFDEKSKDYQELIKFKIKKQIRKKKS